jgi:hypothetical protein
MLMLFSFDLKSDDIKSISEKYYHDISFPFYFDQMTIETLKQSFELDSTELINFQSYYFEVIATCFHTTSLDIGSRGFYMKPLYKLDLEKENLLILFTLQDYYEEAKDVVLMHLFKRDDWRFIDNYWTYYSDSIKYEPFEFISPDEIYQINTTLRDSNKLLINGITRFYISDTLFTYRYTPPDKSMSMMITTAMNEKNSFRNFMDQFVEISNPFILTEDILRSMELAINRFYIFPNLPNALSTWRFYDDCILIDNEVYTIGKYKIKDSIFCSIFIIQAKCNGRLFWSVNYILEKSKNTRKQGDISFGYKEDFKGMSFKIEDNKLRFINNGKEKTINILI